ncbi:hypothetical protein C8R44DRAFT_733012 [Mycena epipterygia]|nr:hypothetical protein C8R44DRAFT_733012 [Mycena epipterygia]
MSVLINGVVPPLFESIVALLHLGCHPLVLGLDWSAYLRDSLIASGFRLPASFDSFDVLNELGPPEPYPLPSFRPPALNRTCYHAWLFRPHSTCTATSGPSNTATHSQSAVQMHGPSANIVRPDYLSRNRGGSPLIVPPTEINVSSKRNVVVISPVVGYVERKTASSSAPSLPTSVILDPLDLPQAFDSTALVTIFLSPRLSENVFTATHAEVLAMLAKHHIKDIPLSAVAARHALICHLLSGSNPSSRGELWHA